MTPELRDYMIDEQPRTCLYARDVTCGLRIQAEEP
jgi:hypothetical protein